MKYIFVALTMLLYLNISEASKIAVKDYNFDEDQIKWQSNRKLKWEDFKGTPPPPEKTDAAASTNCGFDVLAESDSNGILIKVDVTNVFYGKKSWVRVDHRDKDHLLIHEQAHFDLCEIYARKLRKKILDSNFKLDVNKAIQDVFNDFKSRQKLYDKETNHSINKENQAKWLKIISEELNLLKDYSK